MQTLVPDVEPMSLHDQVVRLIGKRWTNSVRCSLETHSGSATTGWPRSTRSAPDLVGWAQNTGRNTPLWIAAVETEDTITEEKACNQWQNFSAMRVPFILIVPRGYKTLARFYATRTGVSIASIYEYTLSENELELT